MTEETQEIAPIVVRFRWNVEELLTGYDAYRRHLLQRQLSFAVYLLIFGGTLTLVLAWATRQWAYGFILLPLIAYALGEKTLAHRQIRRECEKLPILGSETEWVVTADQITAHGMLTDAVIRWDAFINIVESPSGFLLFVAQRQYSWLPRHGFTDNEAQARFAALAKSKVKEYKVV